MTPTIEKISAITLRVMNMKDSVLFYQNLPGMKLLYGGERASFSSLRASDSASAILNLEQGDSMPQWVRLIFHVTDVDAFWAHLRDKGFDPEIPRDAPWNERYFHARSGWSRTVVCSAAAMSEPETSTDAVGMTVSVDWGTCLDCA
jgi:catechol 2,3-dioxygenase-like lactoylglutathione lyase family enzyme